MEYLCRAQDRGEITFLLIGGRSLEAHGYVRNTRDIDLLIASHEIAAMERLLRLAGYQKIAESSIFSRWQHVNLMEEDLDLMFVDAITFSKLAQGSIAFQFGQDSLRVPSLGSIIALKLHATKNDPERFGRDAADILALMRINPNAVTDESLKALCLKYGPPDCWDKLNLLRQ